MSIIKQYKVTLLSDVILNQSAATEGTNETLDFIPGNCFLGIVASTMYKDKSEEAITLFHDKKVIFGDAHPAIGKARSLRVPASLYYPKLDSASTKCYVHHLIPEQIISSPKIRSLQLKQCRNGFYNLLKNKAIMADAKKSVSIKSAHDKNTRTSKDGQLFSYEALQKGLELYFEVCIDESLNDKVDNICKALEGVKHIGRSRSAQYGLVKIEQSQYEEVCSNASYNEETVVYADSRLIFIDRNTGLPTFQPTADDFGFQNGEIVWEKSQVRTFCYAPWNFKRQCFDSDRCGFEKGSVFIIKGKSENKDSHYIGNFNNEGFGKVIFNPAFLMGDAETGIASVTLHSADIEGDDRKMITSCDTPLFQFLISKRTADSTENNITTAVNNWIESNNYNNLRRFKGDKFPSQWGTIRSLASLRKSKTSIWDRLFSKESNGYLVHGVAAEKWREMQRIEALKAFLEPYRSEESKMRMALVNLAAEMAKRLRKKEDKK